MRASKRLMHARKAVVLNLNTSRENGDSLFVVQYTFFLPTHALHMCTKL